MSLRILFDAQPSYVNWLARLFIQIMDRKDYFSKQSKAYAAFRPIYPEELYRFVFEHLNGHQCAWDCATGNGQVARRLAGYFDKVYATDISQEQLARAVTARNIFYSVCPAEHTHFPDSQFDLITVAQAIHWFDIDAFYPEARRTAKPGALIAVWGYGLITAGSGVDELFLDFYHRKTAPYWDPARKMIDNHYRDIAFPFDEIPCPAFEITALWTIDQFAGYLNSWSAVQKYIAVQGSNPVDAFINDVTPFWPPGVLKQVNFPIFIKLGRIR